MISRNEIYEITFCAGVFTMLTASAKMLGFYAPLTDYPSKETMLVVANYIKPKFLCLFSAWLSLGTLVLFKEGMCYYHDCLDRKNNKKD
jgi:hypothetical protein